MAALPPPTTSRWSDAWFDHEHVQRGEQWLLRSTLRFAASEACLARVEAAVRCWAAVAEHAALHGPRGTERQGDRLIVWSAAVDGPWSDTGGAGADRLAFASALAALHARGVCHGRPDVGELRSREGQPVLGLCGVYAAFDGEPASAPVAASFARDVHFAARGVLRAFGGAAPAQPAVQRRLQQAGVVRPIAVSEWGAAMGPALTAVVAQALDAGHRLSTGSVWRTALGAALDADAVQAAMTPARAPGRGAPSETAAVVPASRIPQWMRNVSPRQLARALGGLVASAAAVGVVVALAQWWLRWTPPACATDSDCVAARCSDAVCVPDGFVLIEPSRFFAGSPRAEHGRSARFEHVVDASVRRGFYLQTTEVSQQQWASVMGSDPSWFQACGPRCPVDSVSWYEAVAYANALSAQQGLPACYVLRDCIGQLGGGCDSPDRAMDHGCRGGYRCDAVEFEGLDCGGYRLPTELEWELAARAGTSTATYRGDWQWRGRALHDPTLLDGYERWDRDARVPWQPAWACASEGASEGSAAPARCGPGEVAALLPNPWGIHDMLGNVSEWTHDAAVEYDADRQRDRVSDSESLTARIGRGGAWAHDWTLARAAYRQAPRADERWFDLGFRLARTALSPRSLERP